MTVDTQFAAMLEVTRQLTWPTLRPAGGQRQGTHVARLHGRSPELTEYRLYRQGDDVRDLDWKLLARSDREFVRLSEDRAIQRTTLILDQSPSMAFPVATHAKWRAACTLAFGLGAVAQQAGDPVTLVATGTAEPCVSSTTRRDLLQAAITRLVDESCDASDDLARMLRQCPVGQRVAVISDLLGDETTLRRAASAALTAGSDIVVVHLVSSAELEIPTAVSLAEDPESRQRYYPVTASTRDTYNARFAEWRATCAHAWRSLGATYVEVLAEASPIDALRTVVGTGTQQLVGARGR